MGCSKPLTKPIASPFTRCASASDGSASIDRPSNMEEVAQDSAPEGGVDMAGSQPPPSLDCWVGRHLLRAGVGRGPGKRDTIERNNRLTKVIPGRIKGLQTGRRNF